MPLSYSLDLGSLLFPSNPSLIEQDQLPEDARFAAIDRSFLARERKRAGREIEAARTQILQLARLCFGYSLQAAAVGLMDTAVFADNAAKRCFVFEQMAFEIAAPCVVCSGCGAYVQVCGARTLWNVRFKQWLADTNTGRWRLKCTKCPKRLFKAADAPALKALRSLLTNVSPGEQTEFWVQLGMRQRP